MKTPTLSLLVAGTLAALVGCSGGDPDSTPTAQAQSSPSSAPAVSSPNAPADPIAAVAYDFMDAVFANDIARATQRLTPKAIENLQAQDKRFEWGAAAAKIEVSEVRVHEDEAAVGCLVTSEGGAEQLLCVLRQVGGQWRVYGVAWEGDADGEPQVVNFESLPASPATPPQRPAGADRYVDSPVPQIPVQPAVAERPAGRLQ